MYTHRAVAEVIATLLLVAIAVVGGTIIFVFSQESFNKTQVSGIVIEEIMEMMSEKTNYAIFAVMPAEIRDSVDTRLGSDGIVGSFRINALLQFPNNELMLLGF